MTNKKFFEKMTPLQLVIGFCVIAVTATVIYTLLAGPAAATVADAPAPLSATDVIKAGDEITVRVSAPEVTDMYGYQFELGYDNAMFTAGNPDSLIEEIPTIFKQDFEDHVLVGATMTGDSAGYTAAATDLCDIKLTATADGATPEFTINGVNVVSADADMTYTEDVEGWTCRAIAAK